MRQTDIRSSAVLRIGRSELTSQSLRPFYESASALVKSGVGELVIDLSDVTYMDNASLGCLMDICRSMSKQDGVIKLVGLQDRLQTLAFVAGLTRFIGIPGEDGIHLKNLTPFNIVREKGSLP